MRTRMTLNHVPRRVATTGMLASEASVDAMELSEALREREVQILQLIAEGRSTREIADMLCIGIGTVRWHIKNLYAKLDVHSRTQAVALARARGLIP